MKQIDFEGLSPEASEPDDETREIISYVIVDSADVTFTHSLFVQCFLPVRSLPAAERRWQVNHGQASMVIQPGILVDPRRSQHYEDRAIPAGAKARLLMAYINDQAIRTGRPEIDMGRSLREFMTRNRVPIGGKNGREVIEQAKNIAAARITFGMWGEGEVRQRNASIARDLSFWIERDPSQGTLWQPTITLSQEYMETLSRHRVPLNFRALVGLQASPRAMDVYCWLAYRLRTVRASTKIPYKALHEVFGRGISDLRNFKIHFRRAVLAAFKYYPEARITFEDNYFTLLPGSPPSVPGDALTDKLGRPYFLPAPKP